MTTTELIEVIRTRPKEFSTHWHRSKIEGGVDGDFYRSLEEVARKHGYRGEEIVSRFIGEAWPEPCPVLDDFVEQALYLYQQKCI